MRRAPLCLFAALLACAPPTSPPQALSPQAALAARDPTKAEVDASDAHDAHADVDPCAPTAEAYLASGRLDERRALIPGGRMITPEGQLVGLGRAPLGLAVGRAPDGAWRAYITSDGHPERALTVVDVASGEILQTLSGFEAFRGVSVDQRGHVLIAGGREGRLLSFIPDDAGRLQPGPSLDLSGYLGDLVVREDGRVAYVVASTSSVITEVDVESMTITARFEAAQYPYDLVLDEARRRLYVSNWAGDNVQFFDLEARALLLTIPTPSGPEGMHLGEDGRLWVACADADTLLSIDVETLEVEALDLSHHPEGLLAGTPNDVVSDGARLYIPQADLNQVDIVDPHRGAVEGHIPTGWYPVAVAVAGEALLILNHKGWGATPGGLNPEGLLQILDAPPMGAALAAMTAQVEANQARPGRFHPPCPRPLQEDTLPIERVVLIVRENKTYDMVLGDLEGANGDPSLTLFGEAITPNLHALARRFSNLDNFYSDPEESLQGHMWVTQADCNDFVEKLRHTQLPVAGYEPASMTEAPNIFEHCLNHGVSFRNYGEVASFSPELLGRMRDFIDPKFPFFNMGVRDELKAAEVIREWSLGILPRFIFISLPNDHTFGGKAGKPTPESMVADNDRATGMLVEWLSHSPYWSETVVFIIEDDPQSWRGDHVDAHRSICLAASPWVKAGYVSSVHYNIASLYRTIELILGLPPMNKNDAAAAPMHDLFIDPASGPDLRPFEALPLAVAPAINAKDGPMAAESEALDWSGVDGVDGLGYILWRMRKGQAEPPPYAKGVDR
ncbi:bifunctional YncE family protein/alkaline phosphatase family protein [Myxococcota bacterium]|nr:bifunctional YncE family protein/alkaline phosphatase family protein [Myxococcota bacterium]MBU1896214.1 bifunctional YncE family protein/alkaline phosphatase family protein [Myxococcota bacterium]